MQAIDVVRQDVGMAFQSFNLFPHMLRRRSGRHDAAADQAEKKAGFQLHRRQVPPLVRDTTRLFLIGLPVLLAGTLLGWSLYGKLDQAAFRKVVLVLLLVSGLAIVAIGR